MIRKYIFYFIFLSNAFIYADDALINKKDDVEFAKTLARYGYYDLAEEMRQLIKTHGSYEQKKEADLLNCLFMKEKAQRAYEPKEKKAAYNEAIACYEGHLTSVEGVQNLKLKLDLADLMIVQAQEIIEEARESKEKPTGVESILNGAQERLQDVMGQTSEMRARDLDSKDSFTREKANVYYLAWYALCRVYYFQGISTDEEKLSLCSKELEKYMTEYEGLIGAYYAMLLNGLVLTERGSFDVAIIFYDGVLRPLMNIDDPKAKELSIQACYYQTQTYLKWKKYPQAVKNTLQFEDHMKKTYDLKLEQEYYGQALLLELGKAYVGMGEYKKALAIAEKVGELQSTWGYAAKKFLLEWGQLDPTALQNAKNAYLVATGLYSKDNYHEAILAYLKVIQYSKNKDDLERYGLDAWEKMGQMYWLLGLYLESASCYEVCALKYKGLRKIVEKTIRGKTKMQKISIAAKSAYWAYRAYSESYKNTGDRVDQKKANKMREFLVRRFSKTPYAKNLSYNSAEDKEREAREEKNAIAAIKKYDIAADAYRNVSKQADLYERALVNVGKCYYNAAKKLEIQEDTLSKKPGSRAKELYEKAIRELQNYNSFAQRDRLTDIEIEKKARRQEALAQALFFLGQSYSRLGDYDKKNIVLGIQTLEKLVNDYPEQGDMLAKATYLLVRSNIENNDLAKAETFIKKMEDLYGEEGGSGSTSTYRSFSYYLVGKEHYDLAIKKEEEYDEFKKVQNNNDNDKAKQLLENVVGHYTRSANYLDKWYSYRENMKLGSLEWIASTQVLAAKLLKELGKDSESKDMYKRALRLFRKCLSKNSDKQKEEDLQAKIAECAIETEDWEEAIYVFYPTFHGQREQRRAKGLETDDPLYMDYVAKVLTGLAQQVSHRDPKQLHNFLQSRLHKDLMDTINEYNLADTAGATIFNDYMKVLRLTKEIKGSQLTDGEKEELEKEFKKEDSIRKQLTEEQMLEQKIDTLPRIYYNQYVNLVKTEFPLNSTQAVGNVNERIKNICLYLSYDFTSKLLDRLSPYKNPAIRFGSYDNPQWWETKHQQLLLIHLQGDKKTAKDLIASLRVRQRNMGGEKFQKKFKELEQRP